MSGTERREQLVGVGRSVFAARGFEAATVEEIAAKATPGASRLAAFGTTFAVIFTAVNLIVDLLYTVLNPRLRHG